MRILLILLVILGLALPVWADPDAASVNVAEGNPAWDNQVQGEDAAVQPAWSNTVQGENAQANPAWSNTAEGEAAEPNPAGVNEGTDNVAEPNVDMWQNY